MNILKIRFARRCFPAFLISSSIVATYATAAAQASGYQASCRQMIAKKFSSPEEKLKAIFEFEYNATLDEHPEYATYNGIARGQDRFTDMSIEAIRTRKADLDCSLALVESVQREALKSPKDRLNYDLFRREVKSDIAGREFPSEYLAMSQMGGVHQSLVRLLEAMKKTSVADYQMILARMEKAPTLLRQHRLLLEEGLKQGITPPQETLKPVPLQFNPLIVDDIEKNPLYQVFREMPKSMAAAEQKRIQERARELIKSSLVPELKTFKEFVEKTYIPKARTTLAFTALPNGKAWYAHLVREHTTTDLTPQQIHDIGMKETERIRGEMTKVMKSSGWKKDQAAFFEFLRKDKRFFFKKPEDLLARYREIAKRIDPELPQLFGKLPRLPYGVKAIPAYAEAAGPTAYYLEGSLKAGRAGFFMANTYDLKARPNWEMEALTLHEAVPGHHLQIALAQEMENVPEFRKDIFFTAYIEGWGLYAESLGNELGLFRDSYSKMGQLTYEMWRANRLVVDTGMHALGWTRERSVEFMKSNMPKPEHDIRVEVDRYVVMPGQATAYKIGQLKFLELREKAKKIVGDSFDIRLFHDAVLADGALPLDVLEARMDEWALAQKAKVKQSGSAALGESKG